MNSDVLNSKKDLHEITQLTDTGLSLTIEAIGPMLLRRYLIIWHQLSSLDTSPRKYMSEWEWVNPSIVSHWAGAKVLLEAIFRDRAKGEDEFLKTRVRIINSFEATHSYQGVNVGTALAALEERAPRRFRLISHQIWHTNISFINPVQSPKLAFSGELLCHSMVGANWERKLPLSVWPVDSSPNRQYRSNGLLCKRGNLRSPDIPAEVTLAGEHGGRSWVLWHSCHLKWKSPLNNLGLWDSACAVWCQPCGGHNEHRAEWHLVWLNVT